MDILTSERFKKELKTIREGIYSEKTGQENPNLTIEQFNEIINEVTDNSRTLFK